MSQYMGRAESIKKNVLDKPPNERTGAGASLLKKKGEKQEDKDDKEKAKLEGAL